MEKAISEAIDAIKEKRDEFLNLSLEGTVYQVKERLRLLMKSTAAVIGEHLVDKELLRFHQIGDLPNDEIERIDYLREEFHQRLNALLENVAKYPEHLLKVRQKPAAPNVGPYFSMMHPAIVIEAKPRFDSGQYADAVEAAFKEVNRRVKVEVQKHGHGEVDGYALMNFAFGKKKVIELSKRSNQSEIDEHDGYHQIFAGSMLGIRNPKAHGNISITEERSIHLLMLASLLMYRLDDVNIPK